MTFYFFNLVYNSQDTSGNFEMLAMDAQGKVLSFKMYSLPGFELSPTGKWSAYTRKMGSATNLVIAPLLSVKDSIQITKTENYNGRPKWSVDGKKIAYISDRTGSNEVFIYDIEDNSTIQLTNNQKREKYMSWSPDGQRLAVTMSDEKNENDIFIIDINSGEVVQLTDTEINESEIAWSLKGKYIAYHARIDEKDDIYLIDLTTKEISKVTNGEGYHGEPAWGLE